MLRTHDLGSLRSEHIGQTVTLAGWVGRRRDHGGVAFVDLRDASGVAQVVVREEEVFHGLRNEYVLQVTGTVSKRPEGNENAALATGEVEVMADKVVILNTADALPFQIDEHVEVGRKPGSSTDTWTCAARAPAATSASGPRPTAWPVTCCTTRASSKSRRRP